MCYVWSLARHHVLVNQNWIPYLLSKKNNTTAKLSTQAVGGHSWARTNVLSGMSSNSCRDETQSSAALLVLVHRLPSASDRSEAFWFNLQSESTPQGPEPRSLRWKFTQRIPLLTRVAEPQIIGSLCDISLARLLDRGVSFGDVSVEKERQRDAISDGQLGNGCLRENIQALLIQIHPYLNTAQTEAAIALIALNFVCVNSLD